MNRDHAIAALYRDTNTKWIVMCSCDWQGDPVHQQQRKALADFEDHVRRETMTFQQMREEAWSLRRVDGARRV